jgi:hypothetical protein
MFYKVKVAVCSEIRTKHINAMWAPRRIFYCYTWWYVKLPLGFKRINIIETCISPDCVLMCTRVFLKININYFPKQHELISCCKKIELSIEWVPFILYLTITSNPCTGLDRPCGLQQLEGPKISRQPVHEGVNVVSPKQRPPFPPRKYFRHSFQLEAESTPGP